MFCTGEKMFGLVQNNCLHYVYAAVTLCLCLLSPNFVLTKWECQAASRPIDISSRFISSEIHHEAAINSPILSSLRTEESFLGEIEENENNQNDDNENENENDVLSVVTPNALTVVAEDEIASDHEGEDEEGGDRCCICLTGARKRPGMNMVDCCGQKHHWLHENCLRDLIERDDFSCPLCRRPLDGLPSTLIEKLHHISSQLSLRNIFPREVNGDHQLLLLLPMDGKTSFTLQMESFTKIKKVVREMLKDTDNSMAPLLNQAIADFTRDMNSQVKLLGQFKMKDLEEEVEVARKMLKIIDREQKAGMGAETGCSQRESQASSCGGYQYNLVTDAGLKTIRHFINTTHTMESIMVEERYLDLPVRKGFQKHLQDLKEALLKFAKFLYYDIIEKALDAAIERTWRDWNRHFMECDARTFRHPRRSVHYRMLLHQIDNVLKSFDSVQETQELCLQKQNIFHQRIFNRLLLDVVDRRSVHKYMGGKSLDLLAIQIGLNRCAKVDAAFTSIEEKARKYMKYLAKVQVDTLTSLTFPELSKQGNDILVLHKFFIRYPPPPSHPGQTLLDTMQRIFDRDAESIKIDMVQQVERNVHNWQEEAVKHKEDFETEYEHLQHLLVTLTGPTSSWNQLYQRGFEALGAWKKAMDATQQACRAVRAFNELVKLQNQIGKRLQNQQGHPRFTSGVVSATITGLVFSTTSYPTISSFAAKTVACANANRLEIAREKAHLSWEGKYLQLEVEYREMVRRGSASKSKQTKDIDH